jgi:hypothetical protein
MAEDVTDIRIAIGPFGTIMDPTRGVPPRGLLDPDAVNYAT